MASSLNSVRSAKRHLLMAEVNAVDMETRTVATSEGPRLPFDYLIIATGVTTSYFNHPEWAAHAAGLKTIEDARAIRARILSCFEGAERLQDDALRRKSMTFVVVGGPDRGRTRWIHCGHRAQCSGPRLSAHRLTIC